MNEIDELTLLFLKSKLPGEKEARKRAIQTLAKKLGYEHPKQLQLTLDGKRNLSTEKAEQLAGLYGKTHLEMLLIGRELQSGEVHPREPLSPPTLHVQTVDHFRTFDGTFASEQYIPIRLLGGRAAAGPPSEVRESDIDGWVLIYASREWMPHDPENYTCVRVSGQSMYPILNDGDIVAIDHMERDPAKLDKKMVVFRIDGGITIKWLRYFADKNIVVGVPENKDDFDNVVTLKEDEINGGIVGKVAWWWAKR